MRMTLPLVALLALCRIAPLAGESLPLPLELPADAGEISLEVDNASVEIVVDPGAAPTLQAGLYSEEVPGTTFATFAVTREEGRLTVRRQTGDGPPEQAVWILLTLGPSQRIAVGGTTLRFSLDASGRPPGEATPELALTVAGSEIHLTGVEGATLDARRSHLDLVATRGTLELSLDGSVARIDAHQGNLKLEGTAAQVDVARHLGRLDFELEGSDLTVTGGSSQLHGSSREGSLRLESWDGTGSLEGRGSRIDIRGLVSPPGEPTHTTHLRLFGSALTVTMVGFEGDFSAQLEGGSFDGSTLVGKTQITARSAASVILEDVRKSLELSLYAGSVGRLLRVEGRAHARLDASTLEAEEVRILGIQAQGSEVTARRVRRLDTVMAADSRLDLQLPGLENDPALLLRGEAVARVLLPSPCVVRLANRVEEIDRHLRVTGCVLTQPGAGSVGLREEGTVILKASLEGESSLEVEGGGGR